MDRLVAYHAFIADLGPGRFEEDQRAGLLGGNLFKHGVGDGRYQVRRDVDAVQLAQMPGDLPGAHAVRIHRDDLVIEAGAPALTFGDQLWVLAGHPIARLHYLDLAGVGGDRLAAIAIEAVAAGSS